MVMDEEEKIVKEETKEILKDEKSINERGLENCSMRQTSDLIFVQK